MEQLPLDVQKMFAKLFGDFRRDENERIERLAKANPKAYKDCLVIDGNQNSVYWEVKNPPRKGLRIRFCRAVHKNVAGYYLSWTEVWDMKKGLGRRTNFHGWPTKREAQEYCIERLHDADKPREMRKFILPTKVR
jgi:hypothetical protein